MLFRILSILLILLILSNIFNITLRFEMDTILVLVLVSCQPYKIARYMILHSPISQLSKQIRVRKHFFRHGLTQIYTDLLLIAIDVNFLIDLMVFSTPIVKPNESNSNDFFSNMMIF